MKVVAVVLVIVMVISIVSITLFLPNRTVIRSGLSEKGKEYVREQQLQGNEDWYRVEVDDDALGEAKVAQQGENLSLSFQNECYSFSSPFPLAGVKDLGECTQHIYIPNPKGTIVIARLSGSYSQYDDISHIQFRRNNPDIYLEEHITIDERDYITFSHQGKPFERTAFILTQGFLTAITLTVRGSVPYDNEFRQLLESFQLQ